MKRTLSLALAVACLAPAAAFCTPPAVAPGVAPPPIWLSPTITCSCVIHCGNDKYFPSSGGSGSLDPSACCDQFNSTCVTTGGNVSCAPRVSYTPIPPGHGCSGVVLSEDGGTFVPS